MKKGHCQQWGAVAVVVSAVLSCAEVTSAEPAGPDFRFDIRPLLSKNCFACHGPDEAKREADLRLDEREVAVELGAIVPGSPEESELIRRITSDDPDERMPPAETGKRITAAEIAMLRTWIANGANYSQHWSYMPIERPPLPTVSRPEWCRNGIDNFVLGGLEKSGLEPEVEADRSRLIRRLSLDLTGLPPTIEEVDAFLHDDRADAYERLVDRLLASPAYGEHWARKWLDLARYADTTGYEKDSVRKIWPFRDWVINALNADMPFDEFTIEQLAGDLLQNPTEQQIIATAFHRNSMQNDEGGVDKEEYRVAAVIDRVNTTMLVWMGTTMGCCQCHSHKYDPFTQREYYQMYAFFNQTADENRYDQEPLLLTPSKEQQELKVKLDRLLEENKREFETQSKAIAEEQGNWEAAVNAEINWKPLRATQASSKGGATCTLRDDGSVLVSGKRADVDTYAVQASCDLPRVTAIRLETLPDDSLPGGGPGRADDGSFVLSRIEVFLEPIRAAENVRYVRVELPRHDYLTLSEVQVFRGDENIARAGTATQSSTAYEGFARLSIDGSTHPHFSTGRSISHTAFNDNPWWEVDLGTPTNVDRVVLWNEDSHPYRMIGAKVSLLGADRAPVWQQSLVFSPDLTATLTIDDATVPQFAWARADSERKGFPASFAIEYHDAAKHGWSPEPREKGPHSLVLGLKEPIVGVAGKPLRIVLDHQAAIGDRHGQSLGHFRLLATDDPHAATSATVPSSIREIARIPAVKRTAEQLDLITKYYQSLRPELVKLTAEREDIERRLTEEYRPDKTPIIKELTGDAVRKTHIFVRGSFLNPSEEVTPATPEVFPPLASELPRNRLGLAKWLVDRQNPLTARVVANRHWEQLFGNGIVLTSEDFGSQGTLPTNPQLLDWLAVELMDNGWSLKTLAKTIVMSATYRQSSRITSEKLRRDPDNRLISRGPRARLSAEQIRDQALAASGLLSKKMFGPSVMPPQPEGVWQVVYSDDRWITSKGDDRCRRGIYTFWRRSSPYPSAMALDATSRETCTIRRISTNTPIAAFALLNDPVYVEAAQALARHVVEYENPDLQARAVYAFRRVLSREPTTTESRRLVSLFVTERKHYQADRNSAKTLATSQVGEPDEPSDMAELAAWTVVSNVLLNLDETLTK